MWIFQNPEIIFYHFFCIFNLDIFWVLILQKCLGSRYLVPLTPPTVFGRSFWNFTWAFRMAWRYACGFFRNPEIMFYHFFRIFNRHFYAPNFKEVGGAYCYWVVRPSVRPSVHPSVRSSYFLMHSITLEPWMLLFWNFLYGFLMKK